MPRQKTPLSELGSICAYHGEHYADLQFREQADKKTHIYGPGRVSGLKLNQKSWSFRFDVLSSRELAGIMLATIILSIWALTIFKYFGTLGPTCLFSWELRFKASRLCSKAWSFGPLKMKITIIYVVFTDF